MDVLIFIALSMWGWSNNEPGSWGVFVLLLGAYGHCCLAKHCCLAPIVMHSLLSHGVIFLGCVLKQHFCKNWQLVRAQGLFIAESRWKHATSVSSNRHISNGWRTQSWLLWVGAVCRKQTEFLKAAWSFSVVLHYTLHNIHMALLKKWDSQRHSATLFFSMFRMMVKKIRTMGVIR